jgi:hypothetical protein
MENQQELGSSSDSSSADPSHGGDTGVDFQALFQQTNQQLEQTKEEASRFSRELSSVKEASSKSSEALDKIKAALMGDDGEPADPVQSQVAELEAKMDQVLQIAIESERNGRPIPLTVSTAVDALKAQIENVKYRAAAEKRLAEMEKQLKEVSNPSKVIDQTAYNNMDSSIQTALNAIYGTSDEYDEVKQAQFNSISSQIINEIRDLQKNDPQMWDKIRRNPKAQQNLVTHFVKKTIPPRARQIMEEDSIKKTPLGTDELLNAFREAKELAAKDPRAAAYVSEIRQELLGRMMERNMGGGSSQQRTRMSDLFQ